MKELQDTRFEVCCENRVVSVPTLEFARELVTDWKKAGVKNVKIVQVHVTEKREVVE